MQNLRDKLLKAGLVSQEDSQRSEQQQAKRPPQRPPPERKSNGAPPPRGPRHERSHAPRPSAEPVPGAIPKLPPLALPGSKAHQRLQALKQQELDKKLRELVFGTQVAVEPGTQTFHFATRKGKLRRLELAEAQAKLLEEGKLAVVERQEPSCIEHSLVPSDTAEKMLELLEKSVRFYNRGGKPVGFLTEDELRAGETTSDEDGVEEAAAAAPVESAQSTPEATE